MTRKDYGGTMTIEFDAGGGIQDAFLQQSLTFKTCSPAVFEQGESSLFRRCAFR